MRSLAWTRKRARVRASQRERETAERTSPEDATVEVVQRAEVARRVADAVLNLPEPYRTTLLLRYLEERSAPDIARITQTNVETVRKRLTRGREQLRSQLETDLGGRTALLSALSLWGWQPERCRLGGRDAYRTVGPAPRRSADAVCRRPWAPSFGWRNPKS